MQSDTLSMYIICLCFDAGGVVHPIVGLAFFQTDIQGPKNGTEINPETHPLMVNRGRYGSGFDLGLQQNKPSPCRPNCGSCRICKVWVSRGPPSYNSTPLLTMDKQLLGSV